MLVDPEDRPPSDGCYAASASPPSSHSAAGVWRVVSETTAGPRSGAGLGTSTLDAAARAALHRSRARGRGDWDPLSRVGCTRDRRPCTVARLHGAGQTAVIPLR